MEKILQYEQALRKIPNLDVDKLLTAQREKSTIGVRFNTKKLPKECQSAPQIEAFLKEFGVECNLRQIPWCKNGFYANENCHLGKSILHEMGVYYLQEPSAMAPVEFLDVQKDDVVLDLCASPGGKSTQIAQKLENGFLVANEIVPSRAKILLENVQRLGFGNVIVTNHSPKELEGKFANFFDKILVDAPCSGEGMFRKNHQAIDEWTEQAPAQCSARQKEIAMSAYKMLKPNGIMVYSTCTFSIEENEQVVKFLLENCADLEVLPIEHEKYGFEHGAVLDDENLKNCARLYPYKIEGEGHFFAVLHKKGENFCKNSAKKAKINAKQLQIYNVFENKHLKKQFDNFVLIGNSLYANCKIDIDRLKVLSAGILLGEIRKEVFLPSFHLSHNLTCAEFADTLEISIENTKKYLQGYEIDTIHSDGWVLLACKNIPVAFGKVVAGKIKNHYPKQLRKNCI